MTNKILSSMDRIGAQFPSLMPDMMALKQDLQNKTDQISPDLPHVRGAPSRTPNGTPDAQLALRNSLDASLDKMHKNLIQNIMDYVDSSGLSINPDPKSGYDPAARILANYLIMSDMGKVTAYDKPAMQSFLKLLTFFALVKDKQKPELGMAAKAAQWYTEAQPIFTEMKFNKIKQNGVKHLLDFGAGKMPGVKPETFEALIQPNFKDLRNSIHEKFGPKANPNFFHSEGKDTRAYLTNLLTYYNGGSENALRFIKNNVDKLKEPIFTEEVAPESKVPLHELVNNLKKATAKNGGKGLNLTDDQVVKLKEKNPVAHAEYHKHHLAMNAGRKHAIKDLVRKSGQEKLPVNTVRSALSALQIPTEFIPVGFDGFYDENSNMYAKNGQQFKANIVGGRYVPNPKYDPKKHNFIAKHMNPFAKASPDGQYVYTLDQGSHSAVKNHAKVEHNTKNLDEFKKKWREDMVKAKNPDKAHAHIAEAIYQTSSRIGSRDDGGLAHGVTTYGLRTLQARHVKENADGSIGIKFPGKDAVVQEFKIKPDDEHKKLLVNYIKTKLKNKGPKDPLWHVGNELPFEIPSANDVKKYMQNMGWQGGLHKMRHMKGNELALAYMEKHKPKKVMTRKEADEYVNNLGLAVGSVLGHKKMSKTTGKQEPTHSTALKSYIDPHMIAEFYSSKQVPYPNWLEKLLKTSDKT